jgi:hypothetical protein
MTGPVRTDALNPQQLRGWPAGWTATLGDDRYSQLLRAIDGASTFEGLEAIRDEAASWQRAAAGRNVEAAQQADYLKYLASRKLAEIVAPRATAG